MPGSLLRTLDEGPVTEPARAASEGDVRRMAARLDEAARCRLGRALALRHVDAEDCNVCELELRMLRETVFDLARFGLRFFASPCHADVLVVTGPLTHNMREASERTWTATPDPKWVVAVGDCAMSDGPFREGCAVHGGATGAVPVDLVILGCPPTSAQVLGGLRMLLSSPC